MGFAWVFLDEDALCWHDRITHTYLAPTRAGSVPKVGGKTRGVRYQRVLSTDSPAAPVLSSMLHLGP